MGNDWQGGGANPVYNWIWRQNLVRILSTAKLEGRANKGTDEPTSETAPTKPTARRPTNSLNLPTRPVVSS